MSGDIFQQITTFSRAALLAKFGFSGYRSRQASSQTDTPGTREDH
jgi:hypothetical protein